MKVVLDTNFLIDSVRFKIDIMTELAGNELFVLDENIREIGKLAGTKSKEAPLAKLALAFIAGGKIGVLKSPDKVTDQSLVEYAKQGYAIATHDRILKDKVKAAGSKVVFIRQKKYVDME